MSKRYWKGSDLKIAVELTDKKGNPIPFANVDELTIYLKTTGEEYVKVSKGSGIEADAEGNIYVRLNEHSLDMLPDGLLRYDARWKISAEGWDNGYDTVQSCETDIFVKTPDNYVPKANVQEKSVTYTANGDYILTPDGSYEGISRADIKVELPLESKEVTYTANGDYSVVPSDGYEGLQDVSIHIEIDVSEAENDGVMKFLRKQVTGKVELPIEAMNTPYCLYGQTGITEVVVPEGTTAIPDGFFRMCSSLEKITYPITITEFKNAIYDSIPIDKIMGYPLPIYLQKSGGSNIYYRQGQVFNLPKYFNDFSKYSQGAIEAYNNEVAKQLNFQGNAYRFFYLSPIAEVLDFSHNVQIPTVQSTSLYSGMTKIVVPESLYDTWIATSPWSAYSSITEAVPDTNYYIPYETQNGEDLAITYNIGVKDNRYAIMSYTNKKVCLRGTPWRVYDVFDACLGCSFVDYAAIGIEIPSFEGMFHSMRNLVRCTVPQNAPLDITSMFINCESLTYAPEMDTSKVYGTIKQVFYGCKVLKSVPEYDFSNITKEENCFFNCYRLTDLGGFVGLKCNLNLSHCELTHDSIMNVINKAADVTANPQTLTFGSTHLAKLSDEEKAIATSKGWTLA